MRFRTNWLMCGPAWLWVLSRWPTDCLTALRSQYFRSSATPSLPSLASPSWPTPSTKNWGARRRRRNTGDWQLTKWNTWGQHESVSHLLWLSSDRQMSLSGSWTTDQYQKYQKIRQTNSISLKKHQKPEVKIVPDLTPPLFCFLLIISNLLLLKLRVLCIQDLINNFHVWNHKVSLSSCL